MKPDLIALCRNEFGNIDVRGKLADGLVHVEGKRLQPLCKKLCIEFAPALVGFRSDRRERYWAPLFNGVVVGMGDAPALREAILRRTVRRGTPGCAKALEKIEVLERDRAEIAAEEATVAELAASTVPHATEPRLSVMA